MCDGEIGVFTVALTLGDLVMKFRHDLAGLDGNGAGDHGGTSAPPLRNWMAARFFGSSASGNLKRGSRQSESLSRSKTQKSEKLQAMI